jgi:SPP1 gp7 family putative phage head morphogenesis protein
MILANVPHYPHYLESRYDKLLNGFVRFITKSIRDKILINLTRLLESNNFKRFDDIDDIETILKELEGIIDLETAIYLRKLIPLAKDTVNFSFNQVNRVLAPFLKATVTKEPINIFKSVVNRSLDDLVKVWSITNSRLIKSIPDKLLNDVAILIEQGYRDGTKTTILRKQIVEKFGVTKSRAELIARDQISKLNASVIRHQYIEAGVKNFKWLTSRDGTRVRESHRVLEGKICTWANQTIYKNNINDRNWRNRTTIGAVLKQPGEDYQCRCTPIAILSNNT